MKVLLKQVARIVGWSITALFVFLVGLWLYGDWHDEWSGFNASQRFSDGVCNIAVVPITGELTTFPLPEEGAEAFTNSDDVLHMLRQAEAEPEIQGVLVRIDSQGGAPVASELITEAIKRLSVPVVALIREYGTSGAYFVATGADTIMASAFSDVGGIGITMSYVENVAQNANSGLSYVQLSSGKFKDAGDPNRSLTWEERALFQRDLKIYHDEFVGQVAANRGLTLADVAKLADGSSMPGEMALKNKLIDKLGDQETTRDWLAETLELAPEEVIFCE